ncbi:MAG: cyanophycin synthetase, partial [Phycisphaeraceae bacterium]
ARAEAARQSARGGDRDAPKRPRMAHVACRLADAIMVTSDNPRTEDPQKIINDILAGVPKADLPRVAVEPDRRRAIEQIIAEAQPGDVVLLAGKGHEDYQILGHEKITFDDRAVAREALAQRHASLQEKA